MSEEANKIFTVVMVARQINGEMVFVRTEKAFTRASEAEAMVSQLRSTFVDASGRPKAVQVSTPQGNAACMCEVGVHEVEVVS